MGIDDEFFIKAKAGPASDPTYVSAMERNRQIPSLTVFIRIAKALGTPTSEPLGELERSERKHLALVTAAEKR